MNRNAQALVATATMITVTFAGGWIATQPWPSATRAAHPQASFTQAPRHIEEDSPGWNCHTMGNHRCGTSPKTTPKPKPASAVPAICRSLPSDLWRDCNATYHLTDRDIPGPALVKECIESYPVKTAKPELAICLEPR